MTNKTETNYAPVIREINNTTRGYSVSLADFALSIQRAISTPELAALIEELQSLYEPLDS